MGKILTENGTSLTAVIRSNRVRLGCISALLLMSYAANSFANRPSMQDNNSADEAEYRATESSPSAVEIMMQQQQTQQSGDVLNLPAQEIQPGETIKIKLLDFPRRGASMAKVKQEFGEPVDASDSVGTPPITSWTYQDRIVYFEYSTVLHVVAR